MIWTYKQQGSIILSTFIIVLSLMILGVGVQLIFRNTIEKQFDIAKKDSGKNFRMGDVELQVQYLAEIAVNECIFIANRDAAGCAAGPQPIAGGYPATWFNYNGDVNRQYQYNAAGGKITGNGRVKWGGGAGDYTNSTICVNFTNNAAVCNAKIYTLQLNTWREEQQ